MDQSQNNNQAGKDWFQRHKLFIATVVLIIIASGVIFNWQIEQRRTNWNLSDFPVHQENSSVPSDWKSYQSEEYGFEFRYPKNLSINQLGGFQSYTIELDNGKEFPDIFSVNFCPYACGSMPGEKELIQRTEDLNIGGYPAKIAHDESSALVYFIKTADSEKFAPKGSDLMNAGKISAFTGKDNKNFDLFKKILSTFKFNESDNRILFGNDVTYEQQLECAPDCKFNFDPPTTIVKFSNAEAGIEFDVPYNPKWGTDKYKVNPYELKDDILEFGPLSPFEGGGWIRWNRLTMVAPLTTQQIKDSLNENIGKDWIWDGPKVVNINGLTAVEYTYGELCSVPFIEILGKKYNYTLNPICGESYLEDIAKTIKLLD